MNTSFDFSTMLPPASWQAEQMGIIHGAEAPESDRTAAFARVCVNFDPYVQLIARSTWKRFCRVQGASGLADIESAGRHGLVRAVQRWRPCFEKPFIHFASRWVAESSKAEALGLAQGAFQIPSRVRRLCAEFQRLKESAPAAGDTFVESSRTRRKTKLLVRYYGQGHLGHDLSLDNPIYGERNDSPLIDRLGDEQHMGVPDAAQQSETLNEIRSVLTSRCTPRERLVFYLRFPNLPLRAWEVGEVLTKGGIPINVAGLPLDQIHGRLNRIAVVLGLTRERVRQIDSSVLEKLRRHLRRS